MARITGGDSVRVTGLKELTAALKALGPEFKGEMRKANKSVADFVATDAKSAAAGLGSTPAHVAPSIKASAGAQFAGVALGGGAYPMAAGAEFGSNTYHQFKPWLGSGEGAGYFLWPTIRADRARILDEYTEALDTLIKKVGLET